MAFLAGVGKWIADFALNKLFNMAWKYLQFTFKVSKEGKKNKKQADLVDAIRFKIDELKKVGEPVPPELWQEFRDAVYSLNANFY